MYGYLLGILFSIVATILATYCMMLYIGGEAAWSAVGFGSSRRLPLTIPLLVLGSYLSITVILALFSRHVFNSNLAIAFLLNIAPPVVLIFLGFLWYKYAMYAQRRTERRKKRRAAQNAIDDAPNIHLEAPFVKKVQNPKGGVILLLHVPFTVTKNAQARSLWLLDPFQFSKNAIKYSSNSNCNRGYTEPSYGFYIVNREYIESPPSETREETVSGQLQPNKRYYLLREVHFTHSSCKTSDYDDFDPQQLNIALDISRAELDL